jgi:hypothetical protein
MKPHLLLYMRRDCGLCDEMKHVIRRVAAHIPLVWSEVDIDNTAPELTRRYGAEVPVLLIDGRKAFKYRVSERELRKRLAKKRQIVKAVARTILGRG